MAPNEIAVRARPAVAVVYGAVFMSPALPVAGIGLIAGSPDGAAAILAVGLAWGLLPFSLIRFGAIRYCTVGAGGIAAMPVTSLTILTSRRTTELLPGDALAATDEALAVWRAGAGRWEASGVVARHAHPRDWERLRAWTAATWPGGPGA